MPCQSAGDGGTLCGIPRGYQGIANRTGVYYLPKNYTQGPLPLMVLLHGSGVNGLWMLESLPFLQMADKHQVKSQTTRSSKNEMATAAAEFVDGACRMQDLCVRCSIGCRLGCCGFVGRCMWERQTACVCRCMPDVASLTP